MKSKWLALAAIITLLVGCQTAPETSGWKETSVKGKFSVLMPGESSERTQTTKTALGPMDIHIFTLEDKDARYVMVYNDFPAYVAQMDKAVIAKLLESVRDGAVSGFNGTLIKDSTITLSGGYQGREIQVESADKKRILRSRIYMVKARLYQVEISVPKDEVSAKYVTKYLDSFKVLE
jgi:hypothetical protein